MDKTDDYFKKIEKVEQYLLKLMYLKLEHENLFDDTNNCLNADILFIIKNLSILEKLKEKPDVETLNSLIISVDTFNERNNIVLKEKQKRIIKKSKRKHSKKIKSFKFSSLAPIIISLLFADLRIIDLKPTAKPPIPKDLEQTGKDNQDECE